MGLREMMASAGANAPKKRSSNDEPHLYVIDMSRKGYTNANGEVVPSNQGTVKFIPIVSLSGVETKYAYGVKCYMMEDDEGYRHITRFMDSKDYRSQLTDDQKALVMKCRSLFDKLVEDGWEFPWVDEKNYGMMFGYILEHTSVDGDVVSDLKSRKTALLVFPSKNFAKAVNQLSKDLLGYGDEVADEMYNDLFSRNTERNYYLTATFNKSEGFGYDCIITADSIDRKCVKIATPDEIKAGKIEIPQSEIDFVTEHTAVFIAGDREGGVEDFNEDAVKAAFDDMTSWINKAEEEEKISENIPPIPNKNGKKGKKSDLDEE